MWQRFNSSEHTIPAVKYGGGSIMFWWFVSPAGTGKMFRVNCKIDEAEHRVIGETNFLESVKDYPAGQRP